MKKKTSATTPKRKTAQPQTKAERATAHLRKSSPAAPLALCAIGRRCIGNGYNVDFYDANLGEAYALARRLLTQGQPADCTYADEAITLHIHGDKEAERELRRLVRGSGREHDADDVTSDLVLDLPTASQGGGFSPGPVCRV